MFTKLSHKQESVTADKRTVAISISPTAVAGRKKYILLNMGAVVIAWLWDL